MVPRNYIPFAITGTESDQFFIEFDQVTKRFIIVIISSLFVSDSSETSLWITRYLQGHRDVLGIEVRLLLAIVSQTISF